jgi:hypothetical protein
MLFSFTKEPGSAGISIKSNQVIIDMDMISQFIFVNFTFVSFNSFSVPQVHLLRHGHTLHRHHSTALQLA